MITISSSVIEAQIEKFNGPFVPDPYSVVEGRRWDRGCTIGCMAVALVGLLVSCPALYLLTASR